MDDFELYDGDFEYEDGEYLEDEGLTEDDFDDDFDWGYNEDEGFDPTQVATLGIAEEE